MMLTKEQSDKVLERLLILIPDLPEESTGLLLQLANDAAAEAESYTGRTSIPDGLLRAVGDLALIAYNRMGTEGERSRSEGGESYTFETAPEQVFKMLDRYRLARVGGSYHEKADTKKD